MLNDIKQIQTLYAKMANFLKQEINSSPKRKYNFADFLTEYNQINMYSIN